MTKYAITTKRVLLAILFTQVLYGYDISDKKDLYNSCKRGNASACYNFAEFYFSETYNGVYDKSYYGLTIKPYTVSCKSGIAHACYKLADIYFIRLKKEDRNRVRAFKYYARGCELGDITACGLLGIYYENGITPNLAVDFQEAFKYYKKECKIRKTLDSTSSCEDKDRLQSILSKDRH